MNTAITLEFDSNNIYLVTHLNEKQTLLINHLYENKIKVDSSCCGQSRCFNCIVGGLTISHVGPTDRETINEHLLSSILEYNYIEITLKISLHNITETVVVSGTINYEEFEYIQTILNKRLECACYKQCDYSHSSYLKYDKCELCNCQYYNISIIQNEKYFKKENAYIIKKVLESTVLGGNFVEVKDKDELIKLIPNDEKDLIKKNKSIWLY